MQVLKKVVSIGFIAWILLCCFSASFENLIPGVSYLDEALILFYFLNFILNLLQLKIDGFDLTLFIIIILINLLNILFARILNVNSILQSIFHFKLFVYYGLLRKYFDYNIIKKIIQLLFYITVFGLIVNIFLGSTFNNVLGIKANFRNDLLRYVGFNGHPNNTAIVFVIWGVYYYFEKQTKFLKNNVVFIKHVLLLSLLIFVTGSRTSLLIVPLLVFYHLAHKEASAALRFCVLFFGGIIMIIYSNSSLFEITKSNLQNINSQNESYVRGIMIFSSVRLAGKYFPYGSGLGTFGTVFSSNSHAYHELGIANNFYIKNMVGIYDSNFASLIGELGITGFIVLLFLLSQVRKRIKLKNKLILYLILYLIIISLAYPVFQNSPPAISFALLFVFFEKKTTVRETFIKTKKIFYKKSSI